MVIKVRGEKSDLGTKKNYQEKIICWQGCYSNVTVSVCKRMPVLTRNVTCTMNGKIICKLEGELSELQGLQGAAASWFAKLISIQESLHGQHSLSYCEFKLLQLL